MLQSKDKYIKIRHHLHRIAELSGREAKTSEYVKAQLTILSPDIIIEKLAGYGLAAVFNSGKKGPVVCFRAELDALPIRETNTFEYRSISKSVSHKCGHDGHMAILLGFGEWVKNHLNKLTGKIILLFQPAEETAQGALAVLADKRFTDLKPDYMFSLHNLPEFPLGSVIIRENVFASASRGIKIKLIGKTSHAGHPENGLNPLTAMMSILEVLNSLPNTFTGLDESVLITIIHVCLGEEAFGTSPGEGEIMATFRSNDDEVLDKLAKETKRRVIAIARSFGLKEKLTWVEKFAATVNDKEAYGIVKEAIAKMKIEIVQPLSPFPWSEDFSFFSQKYKSTFFGLGSGETHPQLHNPDYDFPDALIETGIKLFSNITKEVLNTYAANKLDRA